MAKQVIKLSIQSILDDLNEGISWYRSEAAAGETSIEEKYKITKEDIDDIREHPALKGQEPASFTVIELIDDRRLPGTDKTPVKNVDKKPAQVDNKLVNLLDEQPEVINKKVEPTGNIPHAADFDLNFSATIDEKPTFDFLNEL
jgi:hypothetical protein